MYRGDGMTEKNIVLVGAPNVGKSVIFNALTGSHAAAANYSGTTVEYLQGRFSSEGRRFVVTDTPGLYALPPTTEDEKVTASFLARAPIDLIIHVIDAKHIRRMLPMTLRFMESGIPLFLVLNMMDEAASAGVRIDVSALRERLHIPVVATVASKGKGLPQLKGCIASYPFCRRGSFAKRSEAPAHEEERWRLQAREVLAQCARFDGEKRRLAGRLDQILRSPLTGLPILFVMVYLVLYQFVGVFGAGFLVDALQRLLDEQVTPLVRQVVESGVHWTWLREILVGPYGVYSMGLCYACGIVLPIVGLFFFVFSILEDSGYLPRMALLLDRVFKFFGLNGKAVIPLALGFGCGTMAVLVTRTLDTRRERLLSAFLLALAVPCSAQMGVMLSVLSGHGWLLLLWCVYMALVFVLAGYLGNKVLPGQCGYFLMELPPLRLPLARQILRKTWDKIRQYMQEILPIFVAASLVLSLLELSGALAYLLLLLQPLLRLLDLPEAMAQVFLLGFFRRDYGAAGLYQLCGQGGLQGVQLLTAAVVLTLCMPCVAQVMMMVRERGVRAAGLILLLTLTIAFLSGWVVACMGIGG